MKLAHIKIQRVSHEKQIFSSCELCVCVRESFRFVMHICKCGICEVRRHRIQNAVSKMSCQLHKKRETKRTVHYYVYVLAIDSPDSSKLKLWFWWRMRHGATSNFQEWNKSVNYLIELRHKASDSIVWSFQVTSHLVLISIYGTCHSFTTINIKLNARHWLPFWRCNMFVNLGNHVWSSFLLTFKVDINKIEKNQFMIQEIHLFRVDLR